MTRPACFKTTAEPLPSIPGQPGTSWLHQGRICMNAIDPEDYAYLLRLHPECAECGRAKAASEIRQAAG